MLTGDLNAAVVEWVVQYRIVDPYKFLFRVRNVQETLRDMSEAVMREVVGDRTVNEVLTVGRQEVADLVEQELQVLCDQYENGIKIDQVVLQDVNPPDRGQAVVQRGQRGPAGAREADQPGAVGVQQGDPAGPRPGAADHPGGRGLRLNRVNRAQGEAARFDALYARVPQGARGDPQADLPRDDERDPAQDRRQDRRRRLGRRAFCRCST